MTGDGLTSSVGHMTDDSATTYDITYTGSAPFASLFAQMLREQNVEVEYEPPMEERGAGADVTAVVLGMVATGSYDAVKAVIAKFQERFPAAEIAYKPRHKK